MKVSVLIPTLGRSQELIETVKGLHEQSKLPDEIIIVDQNVPPKREVDEFLSKLERVKHLHVETPGVCNNYNRCLREATGDLVIFVDDDVQPNRDLIEKHIEAYRELAPQFPKLGGVAGRIRVQGIKAPYYRENVGRFIPQTGAVHAGFESDEVCRVDFAQGANMSYLRKAILSIGGFDEGFGGNGYFFETDAGLRLKQAGFEMAFYPKADLFHLVANSGGARVREKAKHTYFFIKNGIRLVKRHSPQWVFPIFCLKMLIYAGLKALKNRDFEIVTFAWKAIGERQDFSSGIQHGS